MTQRRQLKLDLGGGTARLLLIGPAHTRGNETTFVEPDATLLSGDIVENKLVLSPVPNVVRRVYAEAQRV